MLTTALRGLELLSARQADKQHFSISFSYCRYSATTPSCPFSPTPRIFVEGSIKKRASIYRRHGAKADDEPMSIAGRWRLPISTAIATAPDYQARTACFASRAVTTQHQ
jgi:hypothetical protein